MSKKQYVLEEKWNRHVPEPATVFLFGVLFGGLIWVLLVGVTLGLVLGLLGILLGILYWNMKSQQKKGEM